MIYLKCEDGWLRRGVKEWNESERLRRKGSMCCGALKHAIEKGATSVGEVDEEEEGNGHKVLVERGLRERVL